MQDYLLESVKLQRINFFLKLVAVSDCSDDEKQLTIQWVSELTDELMRRVRSHEYSRMMQASEQFFQMLDAVKCDRMGISNQTGNAYGR